jgi:hypothetical protein
MRAALQRHWPASAAGDQDAEHEIDANDAICDYPQSGERIIGRQNLQTLRSTIPENLRGFALFGFWDLAISGSTEYTISYQSRLDYTVSIMEFGNSTVVHETQYFAAPFPAPASACPMGGTSGLAL